MNRFKIIVSALFRSTLMKKSSHSNVAQLARKLFGREIMCAELVDQIQKDNL